MADDNNSRSYRSNDPYRRADEPSRPTARARSDDPLAELARLIGQNDPFAELGRSNQRPQPQRPQAPIAHDEWPYAPGDRQFEPPLTRERQGSWDHAPNDGSSQDYSHPAGHAGDAGYHADHGYQDDRHGQGDRRYADDHRYQDDQHFQDDHRYRETSGYQDSQSYDDAPADDRHAQYADAAQHDDRIYDERIDDVPMQAAGDAPQADHFYQDEGPLDPHDDEMYDDAPQARRHSGLATALALIGCALLGTAGAYAYRSYYGHPGSVQPPPVITADNSTPTKIIPAAAGDQQSGKAVPDRLANAGKEQLVSKQEEPVVLKELAAPSPPRVVPPSAPAQAAAPPPTASGPNPNGTAPKQVRTVTIRPDGTEIGGRPMGTMSPTIQTVTTRPVTTQPATTPPAPKAAPAPGRSGGPISLDPQTGEPAPAAAAPARTRAAAATPTETTASTSTGFVVQLSSQKSESEAQSAFRSLQAKFPSELGNREPIIRRADLGTKGVFYRTMVGPFASAQEASQFCASYKAAGGQCIVPSN